MMLQHSTTQCNTVQHSTTQHNTTQHNATQYSTAQHNTTQPHNTIPQLLALVCLWICRTAVLFMW